MELTSTSDSATAAHEPGDAAQTSTKSLTPPYWSHRRYESYASIKNIKPAPITLEDHTEEDLSEHIRSCWARGVAIDSYVVVDGTVPNLGRFVVWNCKIDTLDVSTQSRVQSNDISLSPHSSPFHTNGRVRADQ